MIVFSVILRFYSSTHTNLKLILGIYPFFYFYFYFSAIDQSNTQGGYQNQNQEEEMPQSALILEKLKRFETNTDTKPFSQSSNVNSRFTEQPKSGSYIDKPNELGRGLIDENNRVKIFL